MPNLLSRLRGLRPALTRRAFWLCAALITLLRCAVTHFQLAYMWAVSYTHLTLPTNSRV